MEAIEIKLDEANEIYFNVHVEGTSTGNVNIRLMCEADDFSASFPGTYTAEGEVKVVIPEMKRNGSFKENKDYSARLEVMIENRFFVPLKFDMRFKESVKVFAEVSSKNSMIESRNIEKQQELVEIKKSVPVVSATIVNKDQKSKEIVTKRQNEIFNRLAKKK